MSGAAVKVLVINLDRSPERLAFMRSELDRLGLSFERLSATDAKQFSEQDVEKWSNTYMRPLSRTEIACWHSHVRAWQRCVEEDGWLLVLEDDARLSDRLPAFLAELESLGVDGIVNLETRGKEKWVGAAVEATAAESEVRLYELFIDRGGTAGYLVEPKVARQLIAIAARKAAPSDAFLNLAGVKRHQAEPGLVVSLFDAEGESVMPEAFVSTIQQPTQVSRVAQFIRNPGYKLRRLHGHLAMSWRKLAASRRGVRRSIALCPSFLARTTSPSDIQKPTAEIRAGIRKVS